jgi:very-short-patch-repair endonuclease
MQRPPYKITNRPELREYRRKNRREMPLAEKIMWNNLRMNRVGPAFRRQQSILNFIVDFYCPALGLVVEIDGPSHTAAADIEYDRYRQEKLESLGYDVIRFTNEAVINSPDDVVEGIKRRMTELQAMTERKWWR